MTRDDILKLCDWGSPKKCETKAGPRILRTAEPTDAYREAYRDHKAEMKALGCSWSKKGEEWIAMWWEKPEGADEIMAQREASKQASKATDAQIDIPSALPLLPFQRAGVAFAVGKSGCLFADMMGLGKSCQALATAVLTKAFPLLIIAPSSLKINWRNETSKFFPGLETFILCGNRKGDQTLRSMWEAISTAPVRSKSKVLLNSMRGSKQLDESQGEGDRSEGYENLSRLWQAVYTASVLCQETNLLRTPMRDSGQKREDGESIEPQGCAGKVEQDSQAARNAAGIRQGMAGEEDGAGGSPVSATGARVEVESHRGDRDRQSEGRAASEILDRLSEAGLEDRSGSGRRQSSWSGEEGERRPQGCVSEVARLEGDSSNEQGCAQQPQCRRGPHIVICNYELLGSWAEELIACGFQGVIVDEIHYAKSSRSKRSQFLKQVCQTIPHRYGLTGTIILNRPIELWMPMSIIEPSVFPSFFGFAKSFCNAYKKRIGRREVWDFSGASNLDKLNNRLRESGYFIRRTKDQVLPELPPKRRQIIELPSDGCEGVISSERDAWEQQESNLASLRANVELSKASDNQDEYESAVERLREGLQVAFTEMARLRHATAVAKIPAVIERLHSLLDEDDDTKAVVFAHHLDVLNALYREFKSQSVLLTGETPPNDRQALVDRFQTDPSCRLFIGSIRAAGVGLTLTAASVAQFAEIDWTPSQINQCEDRLHRLGQQQSVLIQHLVLQDSLDAHIAKTMIAKQVVIDAALDKDAVSMPMVPESDKERPATAGTTRDRITKLAESITVDQIGPIHEALRRLAGVCDGAHQLDNSGFSKIDVSIGHSLANQPVLSVRQASLGARIAWKYKRQLPDSLIEIIAPLFAKEKE